MLIRNALIAGQEPAEGELLLEDGRIARVARKGEAIPAVPGDWEADAAGRLVVPGTVDAHTHLVLGALLAQAGLPQRAPGTFGELKSLRLALEEKLDPGSVEALARAGACAALRSGVTCVFDQVRAAIPQGTLRAVAKGTESVGLRAVLSYAASDRGGARRGVAEIKEGARFAEEVRESPLTRGTVGLDGIADAGAGTLDAAADEGQRHGLHATVAEDDADLSHSFSFGARRPLQLLHQVGGLSARTIVAHGSTLDRAEAELLAQGGGVLAVTPRAALWWGGVLPPVESIAARGAYVTLGTDGLFPDPAGDALALLMALRKEARGPSAARELVGRDLWPNGGRIAGRFFGGVFGALREGAVADVVILDWRPPCPMPPASVGELRLACAGAPAAWAFVSGEVRLREGKVLGVDEAQVAEKAREAAAKISRE